MNQMNCLPLEEAMDWFQQLHPARRIATLSPAYVVADAARNAQLEPLLLGYREGDSFWMHGLHRGWVEEAGMWDLQSPYGYGGPVCNCFDQGFLDRAWQAHRGWCRENDILAEFVRLHPLADGWQPYGGSVCFDRETVIIPLADKIRDGYEVRCRTAVRKAEKAGLRVEIRPRDEIALAFAPFYRQGMQTIGAESFYLFNDAYFKAIAFLPDVILMACLQQDDWVSAGLFFSGGKAMEYHLSASSAAGRKLSATNLLIDAAAQHAQGQGLEWLYLGGGTDSRGDNPLFFFKSGFSAGRAAFKYGFYIHQVDAYQQLKDAHARAGNNSNRVLFYR